MSIPSPFRVLYVDNTYTFGGAINALAHLLSAVDRDRIQPMVLSAQPQKALDRLFPGVAALHWPMKLPWVHNLIDRRVRRSSFGAHRLFRAGWSKARAAAWAFTVDLPATARLASHMRRQRVDIVHLNNGVEGLVPALLAARLLKIPVVAHSRGPQGNTLAGRFYASLPERWIAVSGAMALNLRQAGVRPESITTIHDAVDLSRFAPAEEPAGLRSELGIPNGAPVFGIFGRIIPWKGTIEFARAAVRVLTALPNARALIVGGPSDGSADYLRTVMEFAQQSGVGDRFLFTGFRDDIPDVLRLCNVVVHASVVPEPFGMTVIEAMATGRPVVAANSGGPLEILDLGQTGLLVDPRDTIRLAHAILELLTDPERAAEMGRSAARRAHERYSAERYANEVSAVYDRLPTLKSDLLRRRP